MDYNIIKKIKDIQDKLESLNLKQSKLEENIKNIPLKSSGDFKDPYEYISSVIDRDILIKMLSKDLENVKKEIDKYKFELYAYRLVKRGKYGVFKDYTQNIYDF